MLAQSEPQPEKVSKRQSLDERVLWQSLKKGNELAYSLLYNRYVQRLYTYGMHSYRNHDLILDCIQELFTNLWARRNNLVDAVAPSLYIYSSFRRLIIKKIKAQKLIFSGSMNDESLLFTTENWEQTTMDEESTGAINERLARCLQKLTPRQREAVILKFYNGLDYKCIGEIMNLRAESVYNLISKSVEALRKRLRDQLALLSAIIFFLQ